MFRITDGKGFHLTFANGWTVSVQFGYGNYCENYNKKNADESKNAEIAAWDEGGTWFDFGDDTVKAHCTADEVADFIEKVKSFGGAA